MMLVAVILPRAYIDSPFSEQEEKREQGQRGNDSLDNG